MSLGIQNKRILLILTTVYRMKMRAGEQAWRELVDRLLDSAEERPGGYKKMFFMEKMCFQDHMVYRLPHFFQNELYCFLG